MPKSLGVATMNASYFETRCFGSAGINIPFSVASFIVYGETNDLIVSCGQTLLAGHVDSIAREVAPNPTPAQLVSDGERRTGAREEISH